MNMADYGYDPQDAPLPKPLRCRGCGRFLSESAVSVERRTHPIERMEYDVSADVARHVVYGEWTEGRWTARCPACGLVTVAE